jgi:hypothetical protein
MGRDVVGAADRGAHGTVFYASHVCVSVAALGFAEVYDWTVDWGVFIEVNLHKLFVLDEVCDWDGGAGAAGVVGDEAKSSSPLG